MNDEPVEWQEDSEEEDFAAMLEESMGGGQRLATFAFLAFISFFSALTFFDAFAMVLSFKRMML